MYVCLCNGHTSQQLETLARSGVACVERAYEILGGSPACRQCIDYAEEILAEGGTGAPDRSRAVDVRAIPEAAALAP